MSRSKGFAVHVVKFALAIGVLCLFLWPASALADAVSACGDLLPGCDAGSTSVTFTTQSSSQLAINIAGFNVSPGFNGPGTIDALSGSATLFSNGSASGAFDFFITDPVFPPGQAQIDFTSWSETGTPGDMTLVIGGTVTACVDPLCAIGVIPPQTGGTGDSSVSIFVGSTPVQSLFNEPVGTTGDIVSPEPASLLLLSTGLLGLGPLLRRRFARA